MPTASSGLPDDSRRDRKARLSKDDDRLLSEGPLDPADELDVDASDDTLADDDAELDVVDADADEVDDDEDEDDREASGTTLTKKRASETANSARSTRTRPAKSRRPKDQRTSNPFVFLVRFFREVVGEMRKVLWPSRRELIVYTIAVIVFVTVLIAIVGGLDFGFARLVLLIFG